jgi:hypothetical protein
MQISRLHIIAGLELALSSLGDYAESRMNALCISV